MKQPVYMACFMAAIALATYYVFVVVHFGYAGRVADTLFWYPDSGTYTSVADWIASGAPTTHTINRPFLYPLFVVFSRTVAGIRGIWIGQALLWVASGVMLFYTLYRLCARWWVALAGVGVFAANLTLLLLTLHVLTETLTLFLLCVGLVLVAHRQRIPEAVWRACLLAVAALLTVTKPVFLWLFFTALVYAIFGLKRLATRRAVFVAGGLILLACSPVLVQVGIMKVRHHTFSVSRIGYYTVNRYAFAALYGSLNHLNLQQARQAVKPYSMADMLIYTLQRPGAAWQVWRKLLFSNLTAGSAVTDLPRRQPALSRLMKRMNRAYFYLHLAMVLPLTLCLFLAWKQKKSALLLKLLMLLIPVLLVFAASGLAFRQADRLVAPALPAWIALYALTLCALIPKHEQGRTEVDFSPV